MQVLVIPIKNIRDNPHNARKNMQRGKYGDAQGMLGLQHSIQAVGLRQPIIVNPDPEKGPDHYMVEAGSRRLQACRNLDWEEIPAIVSEQAGANRQIASLVENIQREDLSAYEIGSELYKLKVDYKVSAKSISEFTGYSYDAVNKYIRLFERLSPEVLAQWEKGNPRASIGLLLDVAKHPAEKQLDIFNAGGEQPEDVLDAADSDEGGTTRGKTWNSRKAAERLVLTIAAMSEKDRDAVDVMQVLRYITGERKSPPVGVRLEVKSK